MAIVGLTPEVRNRLNQLGAKLPVDAMPGVSVTSDQNLKPKSSYVQQLQAYGEKLKRDSMAYKNIQKRVDGPVNRSSKSPQRVLSDEGFPSSITVTYATPPKGIYMPSLEIREVNFVVLHSFGQGWHATASDPDNAWMNSTWATRGVIPYRDGDRTIYIRGGTDTTTMGHFERFSSGLNSAITVGTRAAAHFFIDRFGNLVVVGDCNYVFYNTDGDNAHQISIELEEAMYVLEDTKGSGNKAVWSPEGDPPGTAGNVQYFAYSAEQLLTLSILVKKLEAVYPAIRTRNVYTDPGTVTADTPPGYTMHGALRLSENVDISPHFLDQETWDAFFALVDSHTTINTTNAFRPVPKYTSSFSDERVEPVADEVVSEMTERVLQLTKDRGDAFRRSARLLENTKASINKAAGENAAKGAQKIMNEVAALSQVVQVTEEPPTFPGNDLPNDSDGQQVGSDDWVL